MGVLKSLLAGAALIAALPSTAAGHVAADPGRASAGAYQAVVFRVGHGCGEAATDVLGADQDLGGVAVKGHRAARCVLAMEIGDASGRLTQ